LRTRKAETIPASPSVPPQGLPMARTMSPTSSASESPNSITGKFSPPSIARRRGRSADHAARSLRRTHAYRQARPLHPSCLDDMIIGDDEARRIDEDTGAERAASGCLAAIAALAEEVSENRSSKWDCAAACRCASVDIDDGGLGFLDDRRERQKTSFCACGTCRKGSAEAASGSSNIRKEVVSAWSKRSGACHGSLHTSELDPAAVSARKPPDRVAERRRARRP